MKFQVFSLLLCFLSSINSNQALPARPDDGYTLYWINKVLGVIGGDHGFLDGDQNSNQGEIAKTTPVLSQQGSIENARLYMHFAGAGYCLRSLSSWTCPWCEDSYQFLRQYTNDSYNTLAYFAINYEKKEIVISFRGSYNIPNALQDADLSKVKANDNTNIKLHRGLQAATQSLYPLIVLELQNLTSLYKDYKVVITGHSLGAALASMTLFYLKYDNDFPETSFEGYFYGQPRCGNKDYADYMNGLSIPIVRTVERADLVAHIGPASFDYYHHHHELFIYDVTNNGSAKFCNPSTYEDPDCSISLGPFYSVMDHLVYFDVDLTLCLQEDPIDFMLQFIVPLKPFIPASLINLLPSLPKAPVVSSLVPTLQNPLG